MDRFVWGAREAKGDPFSEVFTVDVDSVDEKASKENLLLQLPLATGSPVQFAVFTIERLFYG